MSTTYCEQCGSAMRGQGEFCPQCGSAVSVGAVATAPAGDPAQVNGSAAAAGRGQAGPDVAALRGIVTSSGGRARSKAWIYYAILAVLSLIGVFAGKPIGLLGAALCGAYSYYIYQGGRVVIWFW